MNCNACGSTNLIEGVFADVGSGASITFVPNGKSFLKTMFGVGSRKIQSYACVHCGNLQSVVAFSEDDKKQYLKFEGQQPSVTEGSDVLDEKLETKE